MFDERNELKKNIERPVKSICLVFEIYCWLRCVAKAILYTSAHKHMVWLRCSKRCAPYPNGKKPRTLLISMSKGAFVLVNAGAAAVPGGGGREGRHLDVSPCLVARSKSLARQSI